MSPTEEKRLFSRIQAQCKMSYKLADTPDLLEGICFNLSGAGILFETETALEIGRAVEVRTQPNDRMTPPLVAFVEVLRCTPMDSKTFRIAGAIKGIMSQ